MERWIIIEPWSLGCFGGAWERQRGGRSRIGQRLLPRQGLAKNFSLNCQSGWTDTLRLAEIPISDCMLHMPNRPPGGSPSLRKWFSTKFNGVTHDKHQHRRAGDMRTTYHLFLLFFIISFSQMPTNRALCSRPLRITATLAVYIMVLLNRGSLGSGVLSSHLYPCSAYRKFWNMSQKRR
ncbi:hypothetical protein AOLI_G00238830 [Acnodon oligacanthus]